MFPEYKGHLSDVILVLLRLLLLKKQPPLTLVNRGFMELLIGFEPMTCALRVEAEEETVPKPKVILPAFLSFGTNSVLRILEDFLPCRTTNGRQIK